MHLLIPPLPCHYPYQAAFIGGYVPHPIEIPVPAAAATAAAAGNGGGPGTPRTPVGEDPRVMLNRKHQVSWTPNHKHKVCASRTRSSRLAWQ